MKSTIGGPTVEGFGVGAESVDSAKLIEFAEEAIEDAREFGREVRDAELCAESRVLFQAMAPLIVEQMEGTRVRADALEANDCAAERQALADATLGLTGAVMLGRDVCTREGAERFGVCWRNRGKGSMTHEWEAIQRHAVIGPPFRIRTVVPRSHGRCDRPAGRRTRARRSTTARTSDDDGPPPHAGGLPARAAHTADNRWEPRPGRETRRTRPHSARRGVLL